MRHLFTTILLLFTISLYSQNTMRKGNTFISTSVQKETKEETKTQYTYVDNKNIEYPIYLSTTGKAYIKKVSKKTGKTYKQYLPDVGRQINPNAYKNDNKHKS